jgi:hypothetical protein
MRQFAIGFALVALLCAPAGAQTNDDLYVVQTIVTGQGEANRLKGFVPCLEDALVKVSGDARLIGDTRLAPLKAKAADYVASFRYHDRMSGMPVHDEQGTRDRPYDLIVTFDKPKIDDALRTLALAPWSAARPPVTVVLTVQYGSNAYLLASDSERGFEQRLSLAAASEKRGVPIVLPTAAALTAKKTAKDADDVLIGRISWIDAPPGWDTDWRLVHQGITHHWSGRRASFDEAFRDALAGVAQILSGHGEPKG